MAQLRERYHFIHNVFAHFFKDVMDYITYLYPRFEYRVMGTYDKAVEYLQKECDYGRETDKPILPALIVNPSGEFSPADGNAGGRQYWRYPNLNPTYSKRLFDPIYQDDNIYINAGFMRMKGEIELIMLVNSFYEYTDLRMLFYNIFGGLERIIYPRFFTSFIILPSSFINYNYTNPYTGVNYRIDWYSNGASDQLVRSTARDEMILPLRVKPQLSLASVSDASTRYGGTDKLADWRLGATINYEIEIPNYLVIESDYLAETMELEVNYGSTFSTYSNYQPPVNRIITDFYLNHDPDTIYGLDATSDDIVLTGTDSTSTTSTPIFVGDFVFKTRYYHPVDATEEQKMQNNEDFDITIPEPITNPTAMLVNSKYGLLNYGDHYTIDSEGTTLTIKGEFVGLDEGSIIELFVYEGSGIDYEDYILDFRITPEGRNRIDSDGFPRIVKIRA